MTSIHAALVRLNVAAQKISFWKVQLENAIKHAEFLSDFDAEQVSKEKQTTKSELSNFERAIRAGTRASSLQTEEDKIVLHPNIGELYARKIGDLNSLLQNDTTKHQATEIIRSLI